MSLRSLRSRVATLEQRIGGELITIIISGGLQEGVAGFASASGNGVSLEFTRAGDESEDAFQERCDAVAQAAGAKILTIGGLPPLFGLAQRGEPSSGEFPEGRGYGD
jgi:hypothetical protein